MNKIVTVGRRGHFLVVRPPCVDLKAFLTTGHVYCRGFAAGPLRLVHSRDDVGSPPGAYQQAFAGLDQLVREHLVRRGYTVQDDSDPMLSLPPPVLVRDDWFRATDLPLLDLIQRSERVLVRYPRSKAKLSALVAQIALAWPRERIAVAATRRGDARRIADYIFSLTPVTLMPKDGEPNGATRVVIGRYSGLACSGAAELHKPGILIAVNPSEIFSEGGLNLIKVAGQRRIIGLLDAELHVAPYLQDSMIALFGPDRPLVPRHGALIHPPQVVMLPTAGGPDIAACAEVEVKRRGIWNHPVRNRRIEQLVRALIADDRALTGRLFPDVLQALVGRPQRVVVLVEVIEHALALLGRLPEARFITGGDVFEVGLDSEAAKLLVEARSRPSTSSLQIATPVGLRRLKRVDVLIVATGGLCLPLPLWEIGISHAGTAPLIVDFYDRYHFELRRRSQKRLNHYLDLGCSLVGINSPSSALDHFQRTRQWRQE